MISIAFRNLIASFDSDLLKADFVNFSTKTQKDLIEIFQLQHNIDKQGETTKRSSVLYSYWPSTR